MSEDLKLLLVQDGSDGCKETLEIRGGLIAIVGNSGSGKSTLLRLLEAALQSRRSISDRGGKNDPPPPCWYLQDELTALEDQPLMVTPQENVLVYPNLTARNNVLHYLKALPWDRNHKPRVLEQVTNENLADPEVRALAALRAVGLEDRAEQQGAKLSGGEKRRLLLAMDLALGPRVLVADEPLSQLDSSSASQVFDVLKEQSLDGPVLFTVHQPIDEWVRRCDEVWIVERPSRVVLSIPGETLVETTYDLRFQGTRPEETIPDLGPGQHGDKATVQMSPEDIVQTAKKLSVQREGGQPAAYRILKHLKEEERRDQTMMALRLAADRQHPDPPLPPGRGEVNEPPSLGRLLHTLGHEIRDQFLGNVQSGLYWLMLIMFVGVTFFTNFFGGANELPFSVPLATNALLVSILFISTVSGVRIWSGRAGDRIRQIALRRMGVNTVLLSKATPALLEALLIAGLALIGTWLLELRAGASPKGWPDSFAGLPWLPQLPTVVVMMVYVGLVGWTQGMVISLMMTLNGQRGALKHFKNPSQAAEPKKRKSIIIMDPVQQAYSLAVLLVVGQIGLGGAFGQITAEYNADASKPGTFATLVVDGLGSLSPLRWGYNAAMIYEWRQARCRIHKDRDAKCEDSTPDLKLSNECVPGGLSDDTFSPASAQWRDINDAACGRVVKDDRKNGTAVPLRRNAVALYYQAGGKEADRLDRIIEKRKLLSKRKSPFPAESVSESFSAESWSQLNKMRLESAGADARKFQCYQREANTKYEHVITEDLVGKGMVRPELVDVEWCWRACPDAREVTGVWQNNQLQSVSGEYMLKYCPDPGQQVADDVMKALHQPLVWRLEPDQSYVCRGIAHDVFKDKTMLEKKLDELCDSKVLLPQEKNLLFWMMAVALGWGGLAIALALTWSKRLRYGG